MPAPTSIKVEYLVHSLSGQVKSVRRLEKMMKDKGYVISRSTINRIINQEGKRRKARIEGKKFKVERKPKVLTRPVLNTIKRKFLVENPPTYRKVNGSMRLALSTISYAVKSVIKMKKMTKRKVQYLKPSDMQNRKTNSRKLYENVLSGDKMNHVVTLDESWLEFKRGQQPRDHFYVQKGEKNGGKRFVQPVKEGFPPKFMVVGSMCATKTFPLFKVPSSVTVNSVYFVDNVLKPLIEKYLIPHFKEDINKVVIHWDKCASHTSNHTNHFMHHIEEKYGIRCLRKEDIPVKGCDISPLDFFGFGYLKQQLKLTRARTEEGVWKKAREIWSSITPETCQHVYEGWKRRCRMVSKIGGQHVEQTKEIHHRKFHH